MCLRGVVCFVLFLFGISLYAQDIEKENKWIKGGFGLELGSHTAINKNLKFADLSVYSNNSIDELNNPSKPSIISTSLVTPFFGVNISYIKRHKNAKYSSLIRCWSGFEYKGGSIYYYQNDTLLLKSDTSIVRHNHVNISRNYLLLGGAYLVKYDFKKVSFYTGIGVELGYSFFNKFHSNASISKIYDNVGSSSEKVLVTSNKAKASAVFMLNFPLGIELNISQRIKLFIQKPIMYGVELVGGRKLFSLNSTIKPFSIGIILVN